MKAAAVARRVGMLPRVVAYLTDIVIVIGLAVVAGRILGEGWLPTAPVTSGPPDPANLIDTSQGSPEGTIIVAGVLLLYFLTEVFMAASPGKALLGLRIAMDDGRPAAVARLFLRYLCKHSYFYLMLLSAIAHVTHPGLERPLHVLATLFGLVVFMGCFMALGMNRQAYHDALLRTAVYRRRHVGDPATVGSTSAAQRPPLED